MSWRDEDEACAADGRRVRLKIACTGLPQGTIGTVKRTELIGDQWVRFIEWHHPQGGEEGLPDDPFDYRDWQKYIELTD